MKYWFFQNNWAYTLTVTFLCLSLIFTTKLMTTTDKAVINAMINYDMHVADLNLTKEEAVTELAPDNSFSAKTLYDPILW
jgi:hypothetical protein